MDLKWEGALSSTCIFSFPDVSCSLCEGTARPGPTALRPYGFVMHNCQCFSTKASVGWDGVKVKAYAFLVCLYLSLKGICSSLG